MFTSIPVKIVQGHGVASGKCQDPRFPQGSVALQFPFFEKNGLDTKSLYTGTLNLDIFPHSYILLNPTFQFNRVKWTSYLPAENFSFFACQLQLSEVHGEQQYTCYVYWPHPSTKPAFHQPPSVLEVIAPFIPNLDYGNNLILTSKNDVISFTTNS